MPQFFEIAETMYGLMAANQEITLPLWAKLIKFGLLNIKTNDLLRRENEQRLKEEKAAGGGGKGSGDAFFRRLCIYIVYCPRF